MEEPKLILKVEYIDKKLKVTFGTKHEGILCQAIKRAEVMLLDIMTENYMTEEQKEEPAILTPSTEIQVPQSIIGQIIGD